MRLERDRMRLLEIVRRYVDFYEATMAKPWSLDHAGAEFIDSLLDAIVGFTIDIERIEGKWKLNQNHDIERRRKVIQALNASGSSGQLRIAELMSEHFEE